MTVGDGLIDHRRPGAVDHGEDELFQRGTRIAPNRAHARPRCAHARLPRKPSTTSESGPANQHASATTRRGGIGVEQYGQLRGAVAQARAGAVKHRTRRVQREPRDQRAAKQARPARLVVGGQRPRRTAMPSQRDPGAGDTARGRQWRRSTAQTRNGRDHGASRNQP